VRKEKEYKSVTEECMPRLFTATDS